MKKLILILFCINLIAKDFITPEEYYKMLYENPRGISCAICHGDKGEGKIISEYKHKGKNKKLIAPRINNLDFKTFLKNIQEPKGIMPTYFLTYEEIQSLFKHVKQFNKKEKNAKSKKS